MQISQYTIARRLSNDEIKQDLITSPDLNAMRLPELSQLAGPTMGHLTRQAAVHVLCSSSPSSVSLSVLLQWLHGTDHEKFEIGIESRPAIP